MKYRAKGVRVGKTKVNLRDWGFGAETDKLLAQLKPAQRNRVVADVSATIDAELRGLNESGFPSDGYLIFSKREISFECHSGS